MISNCIERHGGQIKISKEHILTHQQPRKPNIGKTWPSQCSIMGGTSAESIRHRSTEEQSMERICQECLQQNVSMIRSLKKIGLTKKAKKVKTQKRNRKREKNQKIANDTINLAYKYLDIKLSFLFMKVINHLCIFILIYLNSLITCFHDF